MKILAIHNFHRKGSASGDDQVFKSETALLESHGNQVVRYTVSNDEFDNAGVFGKLSATFGMLWSSKNYKAVQQLIQEEKPDIIHIHTFFPLLSPSILYAAKRSGVKVVATLHDTRFVCPCSTSLRGTELCNECGDGRYFRMCKYGCFKNSKLQSFIVAGIFTYHRIRKSFYKQIDRYICLNENQIRLLTNIGFDKEKIIKKYNFVPDTEENLKALKVADLPERYVVFYGRIGEEKGIRILMKIWDDLPDIPLVVMGGGPLEEEFRHWADRHDNVYFLGYTQHDKCLSIVKGGEFVIRPSSYYGGDYGIGLTIGEHSSIGPYGYVGCSGRIVIGKNVMFGPKCSLFAENHVFSNTDNSIKSQGVQQKGITIEDDCWIGSNVIILDGVTIGKGSVIGAGTLVSKDVPAGSVVVDKREKMVRER